MTLFICVFLLPILAVNFFSFLEKKEKSKINYFMEYLFFFSTINFTILFALAMFFGEKYSTISNAMFNNIFIVKYSGFSLFMCLIIPLILFYIKSVIKINFSVENLKKDNVASEKNNNKK